MIFSALNSSAVAYKVLRHRHFQSRICCFPHGVQRQRRDAAGSSTIHNYREHLTPPQYLLKKFQLLSQAPHLKYIINPQISACGALNYHFVTRNAHTGKTTDQNPNECEPKKKSKKKYYFAGAVLIFSGVIGYAKYDQDFRDWLDQNVPGSSNVVGFIFQEEKSFVDYITDALDAVKDATADAINNLFGSQDSKQEPSKKQKSLPPCDEDNKPYRPPRSAFRALVPPESVCPPKKDDKYTERREVAPDNEITDFRRSGPPQEGSEESEASEPSPEILAAIEDDIGKAAQTAIDAYKEAVRVMEEHADELSKMVESSVDNMDPKIWSEIKEVSDKKEQIIAEAETNAKLVEENIEKLKESLENPKLVAPGELKERAKKNMKKVLEDVAEARRAFERERYRLSVTMKYWNKVEEARKYFSEELAILLPNVKLTDRQIKLAEGEIDLFVLYAYRNMLFYQKELSKLETIGEYRIKRAVEQAESRDPELVKTAVEAEMDKERRKLQESFEKRSLNLKSEFEQEIRQQLKRQVDAHNDHLNEVLALKEKEVERKLARKVEEQIIAERTKFKEELAGMVSRLKGLDEAIKKRADQDKYAQQSQVLWSACQTLVSSLKNSDVNQSWDDQLKPLDSEVKAILKAADKDDLVQTIVKTIPEIAVKRGVYSESALRERFLHVEKVASIVSLVPDENISLPLILLSYIQNALMIKNPLPIPAYELANEPIDPSSFSTFDILQRARFWMDRGDIAQALKYMNLLSGGPRAVAYGWIQEAQIMLETQQAANVLLTHASASGLVYS